MTKKEPMSPPTPHYQPLTERQRQVALALDLATESAMEIRKSSSDYTELKRADDLLDDINAVSAMIAQAPALMALIQEQVTYAEHCPMGQLSVLGIDWMNQARTLLAQIEEGKP